MDARASFPNPLYGQYPNVLRDQEVRAGKGPVPIREALPGDIVILASATERIVFDPRSLVPNPAAAMMSFYTITRMNSNGVAISYLRTVTSTPDGWTYCHTNSDPPFCYTPELRVFVLARDQDPVLP